MNKYQQKKVEKALRQAKSLKPNRSQKEDGYNKQKVYFVRG